jgi:iron-sulfur cluster repair protein YtfE (RIC family)
MDYWKLLGLATLMEKVFQSHAPPPRHPELKSLQTVFESLRADLEPHLLNEGRVLFLLIEKLKRDRSVTNASHNGVNSGHLS